MYKGGEQNGYTVLETMIFLGISTMLFLAFTSVFDGRQRAVEFTQATRDTQIKIQSIINEVASGYFPSNAGGCVVGGGASSPPVFTGAGSQGTSNQCVFLGKAIHMGTTDRRKFNTISIAGRRLNGSNKEVSSLTEAVPTPISSITQEGQLQYNLYVTRIAVPSVVGSEYGTIAFITTLPKFQGQTRTLASGAQRVSYAAIPGTSLNDALPIATGSVSTVRDTDMNPPSGIYICLADEADVNDAKQKTMIVIGEGASQTSARLEGEYNTAICEG